MVRPPAWLVSTLRKIESVPRVTMIEGTRPYATSTPLTTPSSAPTPMANARATGAGRSGLSASSSAVRYAATPNVAPTDRSMLRVMMTSASPAARTAVIEIAMASRLTKRLLR